MLIKKIEILHRIIKLIYNGFFIYKPFLLEGKSSVMLIAL